MSQRSVSHVRRGHEHDAKVSTYRALAFFWLCPSGSCAPVYERALCRLLNCLATSYRKWFLDKLSVPACLGRGMISNNSFSCRLQRKREFGKFFKASANKVHRDRKNFSE